MQIVFLGARGSGKTTVGKLVAIHFGFEFVDVDDLIVARSGKSIKAMFAEDGEPSFRDVEAGVLEDAIRWQGDRVISLGGGTVLRESNRETLKRSAAYRYYLRVDAEVLNARINADPNSAANRPSLTNLGHGIEEVKYLSSIREPFYREVMTREIDATQLTPKEIAMKVIGEVKGSGECGVRSRE